MSCFGKEEAESVKMEHNSAESVREHGLSYNDRVNFPTLGLEYRVETSHLDNRRGSNEAVFSELGLSKYDFCSGIYGYSSRSGSWPSCESRDYEALARVVIELYDMIDGGGSLSKEVAVKYFAKQVEHITKQQDEAQRNIRKHTEALKGAQGVLTALDTRLQELYVKMTATLAQDA